MSTFSDTNLFDRASESLEVAKHISIIYEIVNLFSHFFKNLFFKF